MVQARIRRRCFIAGIFIWVCMQLYGMVSMTAMRRRDTPPSLQDSLPLTTVLHEIDTLHRLNLTGHIEGYLHFTNIALHKDRSGRSTLHVFQPSIETRRALNTYTLPKYYRWSYEDNDQFYDLMSPRIVIQDRPMDSSIDCPSNWRHEIAYFYSPWVTKNFFHLHNDNILCMVDNIRHTPGCDNNTLECDLQKALYLFEGTEEPHEEVKAASELKKILYDSIGLSTDIWVRASSERSSIWTRPWRDMWRPPTPSVCFSGLSWGRGPRFYYEDGKEHKRDVKNAVTALNQKVQSHYKLSSRVKGEKVNAIYVNRNGAIERNLEDPRPIMEACKDMGWECDECCDWKNDSFKEMLQHFRDAQVVFGPHGAGLAHVLYARPNATLVDFGEPNLWFRQFGRMVASVGSGDRIRVPETNYSSFHWSKQDAMEYFQKVRTTATNDTASMAP